MLIMSFASCAKSDVPDGYQLAVCEGDKFRLYVPTQGWMPNVTGGVSGAFSSLEENASVSVYIADDAGDMSLEEYWSYCDAKYAEIYKEYSSADKSEKLVLGGQPAQKNVYQAKMTVEGVTETYKFMQVTAIYEGEMYILLYTSPEKHYDSHLEELEGNADGEGIIPYFIFAEPYSSDEDKKFSDKVTAPDGMELISADERAYRFFVPNSWVVNERAEISAAYASETDSSNVSLQMYMTENEAQKIDEYFADCEKKYAELFTSYTVVSAQDIKMSGLNAKKYTLEISSGGIEYKMIQAIVKKGAMFYCFTYTATADNFEKHLGDVDKMINSFEIR
jgi:hypothetical protein